MMTAPKITSGLLLLALLQACGSSGSDVAGDAASGDSVASANGLSSNGNSSEPVGTTASDSGDGSDVLTDSIRGESFAAVDGLSSDGTTGVLSSEPIDITLEAKRWRRDRRGPDRPVATPPVASPPVASPPVASPPVASPPVASPPVASPPVASPPVASPPVASPPVASPPVASPQPDPTAIPPGARVIYVSPAGDDARNGAFATVTAQGGPIKTIQRSQQIVRTARATGAWPAGGFVVTLLPGRFEWRNTLNLDGNDSGTANAPVIYRGSTIDGVRASQIVGSVQLNKATRGAVSGRPDLVRISAGVALSASSGVTVRRAALTEARWPNDGFTTIAAASGSLVTLAGEMPALTPLSSVSLNGFAHADWLFENLPATAPQDGARNVVQLSNGSTVRVGARSFVSGPPALLDRADEYSVEPGSSSVVVSSSIASDETLEVSVTPMLVYADGLSNVRFEDLSFCNTTANGLELMNVESVVLSNVEICNTGGWGVQFSGHASGVRDSYLHALGGGGVYLYGGNRPALTPGAMFAETSIIEDFGRRTRSYSPAVRTEGVGGSVSGNLIKGSPHVGVMYSGNDHQITFNDISDVVKEAGDMGAIYSGRSWTGRGNVIRGNLVHDVVAPGQGDGRGVYLDDQFSSATVEQNIFSNVKNGVFLGGGRHNMIRRNIFFSSSPSIYMDARGLDIGYLIAGNQPVLEASLNEVPINSPLWSQRYPELARIRSETPMAPVGNRINENVIVDGQPIEFYGPSPRAYMTDNVGASATVRPAPTKWTGTPDPSWLVPVKAQVPGADTLFPWTEFQQKQAKAAAARR